MAIEVRQVPIDLGIGLNQKVDEKNREPGQLETMENAIVSKLRRVEKTPGVSAMTVTADSGTLGKISTLSSNGKRLLAQGFTTDAANPSGWYQYQPTADRWAISSDGTDVDEAQHNPPPGMFPSIEEFLGFEQPPDGVLATATMPAGDAAGANGKTVVALKKRNDTTITVLDDENQTIITSVSLGTSATKPRVRRVGNFVAVFYMLSGTGLVVRIIDTSAAAPTIPSATTVDGTGTGDYNVASDTTNSVFWVVYERSGGPPNASLVDVSTGGTVGTPATVLVATEGGYGIAYSATADRIYVATHDGTQVRCSVFDTTPTFIQTNNLPTVTTGTIFNVKVVEASDGIESTLSARATVMWNQLASSSTQARFDWVHVDAAGAHVTTVTSSPYRLHQLQLIGEPFLYDGFIYAPVGYFNELPDRETRTQAKAWLVRFTDESGTTDQTYVHPVALLGLNTVSGSAVQDYIGNVQEYASGQIVGLRRNVVNYSQDAETYQVDLVRVDLRETLSVPTIPYRSGFLIGGGGVSQVFNQEVMEVTPYLAPSIESVTDQGIGSTFTFSYKVTVSYVDAEGNLHRSAPSAAVTDNGDLVASAPDMIVDMRVGNITARDNSVNNLTLELWRSDADGSIHRFIRGFEIKGSDFNNATIQHDGGQYPTTDANLLLNEILYTDAGKLANDYPPPAYHMTQWRQRVVMVNALKRSELWASQLPEPGLGLAFNAGLTIQLPIQVEALAEINGNLLIFGDNEIHTLVGEGPANNGVGAFQTPERIYSQLGCINWRSVAVLDGAVFFQSQQGFYTIGSGLDLNYIGAAVEDFGTNEVYQVSVDRERKLLYVPQAARMLVYDYQKNIWSVRTLTTGEAGSTVYDGSLVVGDDTAGLLQENATYQDEGSLQVMKLQTSWISLAGIAGYQRLRKATFSVENRSACGMKITIETDKGIQTETWTEGEIAALAEDELVVRPKDPLCTRIRFTIEDTAPAGAAGESYRLVGLQLEVGVLPGQQRLAAGNRR